MDRIYYINDQGALDYIPDHTAGHGKNGKLADSHKKSHCFTAYSSMSDTLSKQPNLDHKKSLNYNQIDRNDIENNNAYAQNFTNKACSSDLLKSTGSDTLKSNY